MLRETALGTFGFPLRPACCRSREVHATGMMSPDEWIHRGLEFAWKTWECRSEDRGGGGAGGESHDIADELRWLDLAIECFSKAGPSGKCLASLLAIQNLSQYMYCLLSLLSTEYTSQLAGDEYVNKAKLNRQFACFLNELRNPAATSMQQTERNGVKLVAACIKEGMWLESHSLASLLPLKSVANLDYRVHLRTQRILNLLEVGGLKHNTEKLKLQNPF